MSGLIWLNIQRSTSHAHNYAILLLVLLSLTGPYIYLDISQAQVITYVDDFYDDVQITLQDNGISSDFISRVARVVSPDTRGTVVLIPGAFRLGNRSISLFFTDSVANSSEILVPPHLGVKGQQVSLRNSNNETFDFTVGSNPGNQPPHFFRGTDAYYSIYDTASSNRFYFAVLSLTELDDMVEGYSSWLYLRGMYSSDSTFNRFSDYISYLEARKLSVERDLATLIGVEKVSYSDIVFLSLEIITRVSDSYNEVGIRTVGLVSILISILFVLGYFELGKRDNEKERIYVEILSRRGMHSVEFQYFLSRSLLHSGFVIAVATILYLVLLVLRPDSFVLDVLPIFSVMVTLTTVLVNYVVIYHTASDQDGHDVSGNLGSGTLALLLFSSTALLSDRWIVMVTGVKDLYYVFVLAAGLLTVVMLLREHNLDSLLPDKQPYERTVKIGICSRRVMSSRLFKVAVILTFVLFSMAALSYGVTEERYTQSSLLGDMAVTPRSSDDLDIRSWSPRVPTTSESVLLVGRESGLLTINAVSSDVSVYFVERESFVRHLRKFMELSYSPDLDTLTDRFLSEEVPLISNVAGIEGTVGEEVQLLVNEGEGYRSSIFKVIGVTPLIRFSSSTASNYVIIPYDRLGSEMGVSVRSIIVDLREGSEDKEGLIQTVDELGDLYSVIVEPRWVVVREDLDPDYDISRSMGWRIPETDTVILYKLSRYSLAYYLIMISSVFLVLVPYMLTVELPLDMVSKVSRVYWIRGVTINELKRMTMRIYVQKYAIKFLSYLVLLLSIWKIIFYVEVNSVFSKFIYSYQTFVAVILGVVTVKSGVEIHLLVNRGVKK